MMVRPSALFLRLSGLFALVAALTLITPTFAEAQSRGERGAIGENYRVEFTTNWWNPEVAGAVTSDRLDIIGSRIDLVDDLGFEQAKFKEWRLVLRPGKKHKVRLQYTPLHYDAEGVLTRDVTYAGKTFAASLPIASKLDWKVWRIGYEWDLIYKSRGFIGVLFEARKTEFSAAMQSLVAEGSFAATAPLPSIGFVARAYPLPDLALNFEVSTMKVPMIRNKYKGNYTDMDLSATVNVTNSFGVSGGWRRLNTALHVDQDFGDLKFQGLWFGGAVRF